MRKSSYLAAGVSMWIGLFGCSEDDSQKTDSAHTSTGGQSAPTGGTNAGAPGMGTGSGGKPTGGGGSGAAGRDNNGGVSGAAVGLEGKEAVWVTGVTYQPQSCSAICAEVGDECAPVCGTDDNAAVDALYTYHSNININHPQEFASCSQAIAESMTLEGHEYTLTEFQCCCLAAAVTRVQGDPLNRMDCDTLCASQGLRCNAKTDWGDGSGKSASISTYTTKDGSRTILGDCNEVPEATVNRIGNDEPLAKYRCGCIP